METREAITLDARAQQRLVVLTHVLAGELELGAAAAILGLSVRQIRRLVDRFRAAGAGAFVHGNRGRVPVNRVAEPTRLRIVELATTTYAGFNPVHLAETLAEEEALALSARTVRRILVAGGVPAVRTRRPRRHRSRRERMPRAGMLLQVDGSRHDWLEGRGPVLTLVGAIDDATGVFTAATFRAQEDAAGYLTVLARTVVAYGRPLALYSDRHGIFVKDAARPATLAEQLTGKHSTTQVGRALDAAGIGWIGATSPQAKGRIERGWGTAQDRLCSELRRAGATTSMRPTSSSPGGWPATMPGSPSRRPIPSRPGGRGPPRRRSRPSSASTTRAGLRPTQRSAGRVARWPCRGEPTGGRGPAPGSWSRSDSTAACGSTTAGSTIASPRRQRHR